MISSNKISIQAVPKEQLCINKDSAYEYQEQNNHPAQQDQSNPRSFEPLLQNNQIQETSLYARNQTQVQVCHDNDKYDQSCQLYNAGQKRVFALSVVTLWIFQILIELLIVIKQESVIKIYQLNFPCFFTTLLIMAYTLYDNYPMNKMKQVRLIDQFLFILYFIADIFTNFAFYSLMNDQFTFTICVIIRSTQVCNLICSLFTLAKAKKIIQAKYILLVTLIPFAMLILFSYLMDQWLRNGWVFYLISFAIQLLQIALTFNLVRVLNGIYSKNNKKIDINNIYTGFIIFKYSYYIPF